jgi:hypothetical protein
VETLKVCRVQEVTVHLEPMFVLSLRGDAAMWRTSGKSGTSSAQEMLTSLESVCDSLRSSLNWQKTRSGFAKIVGTQPAKDRDDESVGISIA